tara:strand:- start:3433 stop:4251 length:819 start_codon:yes stop_codon:yes gene_type:complete
MVKSANCKSKRNYDNVKQGVINFYKSQHSKLNYKVAKYYHQWYEKLPKKNNSLKDILLLSDDIYDISDPDINESQIHHAFQTAELCRKMCQDNKEYPDWLPLIGLIHDLGKVIHKLYDVPIIYLCGDSFPLGCKFSDQLILPVGFDQNKDIENKDLNTKFGLYNENCGFNNLLFWGHDEVMYISLIQSKHNLPEEALYVIKYHSFYAWHQNKGYDYLANQKDLDNLKYLKMFQKADLYSKSDDETDLFTIDKLDEIYYTNLIKKYLPNGIVM